MDLIETQYQTNLRHPWETSRFTFFAHLLGGYKDPVSVLDAGAGDGWFAGSLLPLLPEGSTITCYDMHYTPAHLSELYKKTTPGISFTAEPPSEFFDVLLLLDVAEHVEDDQTFLNNLVEKNLVPDGRAVFSIPAWPWLFSDHDRFLQHFRRYTPTQATALVRTSGLEIRQSGGLFHLPFIARSLLVGLGKIGSGSSQPTPEISWQHGTLVTGLVSGVLYADTVFSRLMSSIGINLPGLSWWASCRKPT